MALENTTFIAVADVKSHLDITDTTWDTVIENLINQVTRFAMNYCGGRRFIAPTDDETEYYNGAEKIFLRSFPIKSITGIYYRSGNYDSPVWTAFNPATDYILDSVKGILHMISVQYGTLNIKVVYKGGFDGSSSVPSDLKMAIIEAVSREFNRRKSIGMTSESVGGASVNWNIENDKLITAILDNYRIFLP